MKRKTPLSHTVQFATATLPCRAEVGRRRIRTLLTLLTLTTLFTLTTAAVAQTPDPSSVVSPPSALPVDPGVFAPFVAGLLGKYGWLTTVLLAIGSLRILFKPVMLVVENTVKNDPTKLA